MLDTHEVTGSNPVSPTITSHRLNYTIIPFFFQISTKKSNKHKKTNCFYKKLILINVAYKSEFFLAKILKKVNPDMHFFINLTLYSKKSIINLDVIL